MKKHKHKDRKKSYKDDKKYKEKNRKHQEKTDKKRKFEDDSDSEDYFKRKSLYNFEKKRDEKYTEFEDSSSKPGTSRNDDKRYENYHSRKHEKRRESDHSEDEKEIDFTYLKYKHDLSKIFSSFPLVENIDEFWLFVKKYETLEKTDLKKKFSNSSDVAYNRLHCLNFSITCSSKELFLRVPEKKQLTSERLQKFEEIVMIYIDYKQKEKFQKLKKVRNDQANLPVAQFRNEIVDAVRNERVVIIAGDTGCGKSTQVPQYLFKAGFGKIGKNTL